MENTEIQELREQYYQAILCLESKEEILNSLPNIEYQSFFPLINGLLELFDKEIKECDLTDPSLSTEDLVVMKEYLESLEFKKNCCQERLNEANKILTIESEEEALKGKTIIFATTTSERPIIERDIKDIPQEKYDTVLETLLEIESPNSTNNVEKGRTIAGNSKLSSIRESKGFKVRIYYRLLPKNCAFVFMASTKKDDNPKNIQTSLEQRKNNTEMQFKKISDLLENGTQENIDALFDKNKEFQNDIINTLTGNQRGVKHGKTIN